MSLGTLEQVPENLLAEGLEAIRAGSRRPPDPAVLARLLEDASSATGSFDDHRAGSSGPAEADRILLPGHAWRAL